MGAENGGRGAVRRDDGMRRRDLAILVAGAALAWPLSARTQPAGRLQRVGPPPVGPLLKELLPGLSKAALVLRTEGPENTRYIEEARHAERDLKLPVQVLIVRDADDLARALGTAEDVRALAIVGDAQFTVARARIAELALKHRLPTMFTHSAMVEDRKS